MHSLPNIDKAMKSRSMEWAEHVAHVEHVDVHKDNINIKEILGPYESVD